LSAKRLAAPNQIPRCKAGFAVIDRASFGKGFATRYVTGGNDQDYE
jgi:hypothetical protein